MDFKLNFPIEPSAKKISIDTEILTIGSCFSDVVGGQFIENKLNTLVNPFGTIFSPIAIFKLLKLSILNLEIEHKHLVESDEYWQHYDFHSKYFASTKEALLDELKNVQLAVNTKLKKVNFLIITLGTAFVYEHFATKNYVANCHKMPANLFRKDLIHVKHICQEFEYLYLKLKEINPKINIILTVSPVRHIKDGIAENQVSKSILRAACHYLCIDFKDVSYFPSYEIMIDELRDYRFYKSDLIHPSSEAEQYIFEKFSNTYFDQELIDFLKKWTKIKTELNHRPINENSEKHQEFLKTLFKKLNEISAIVNVEKEKELVLSRIFVG